MSNASHLEGTLHFIEGVSVVAHEAAGLGDVAEFFGQLQQGELSSDTLC